MTEIPEDVMRAAREAIGDARGGAVMVIARAILAERERSKWNSFDTVPKDGREVILWAAFWNEPVIARWHDNCWFVKDIPFVMCVPTHWQPLPEPPKNNA